MPRADRVKGHRETSKVHFAKCCILLRWQFVKKGPTELLKEVQLGGLRVWRDEILEGCLLKNSVK